HCTKMASCRSSLTRIQRLTRRCGGELGTEDQSGHKKSATCQLSLSKRLFCAATSSLAVMASVLLALPATAEEWPAKTVRIIYNYPAGTGGDVITRTVADALHKKLGQPFVVENRAGAAGTVGVEAATRFAPSDGYTFLSSPNAPMVLLP